MREDRHRASPDHFTRETNESARALARVKTRNLKTHRWESTGLMILLTFDRHRDAMDSRADDVYLENLALDTVGVRQADAVGESRILFERILGDKTN